MRIVLCIVVYIRGSVVNYLQYMHIHRDLFEYLVAYALI